ncbi:MAG TPA: VCBS repeat-containing protein, partial [Planctomycetes bacterium]|nr:VCBS repeat-containing protein [Planctomycetota bacterium]
LPWHDANNGPSNHLFRNDGKYKFTDVTREVGLDVRNRKFTLAASWSDYDNDGDPDLYVANDFGRNNLYRNDGGKFVDVAGEAGVEDQAAGMGVSWADVDRDGMIDLHVGNMFSSAGMRIAYQNRFKEQADANTRKEFQAHAAGNALYSNRGDGTFEHRSDSAGIRMGRWSWGARFADLNLDGYPEILSPNGFITNHELDDL